MKNLVPSETITVNAEEIEMAGKQVDIGHKIKIDRSNQTNSFQRKISLGQAAFGNIKEIFKSNQFKKKNKLLTNMFTSLQETLKLTKESITKLTSYIEGNGGLVLEVTRTIDER